jgi:hypothetical protein
MYTPNFYLVTPPPPLPPSRVLFVGIHPNLLDGGFAIPGSGGGICKSETDSKDCCGSNTECRADFKCHSNSCDFNDCPENSMCVPGMGNSFSCQCNEGFRDVGKGARGYECSAFDHCVENNCASNCDCESVVNATMDGYFCHPKSGDIS